MDQSGLRLSKPMPLPLPERVLTAIRRHRMLRAGDRVGLAVSGGGDSTALLLLLVELRKTLGVRLAVLHFNHLLRGAAAESDEKFAADLAAAHHLEFLVRREDVWKLAREAGMNLEAMARARRYAWFDELAETRRLDRVATGHTADDQAETVLARLARGTGLRGLGAIHPVRGAVVRPLLDVEREELRRYLAAQGQQWREDETNLDTSRLRARIRLRVLPMLEAECGPAVKTNLARLADLARADEALLAAIVQDRFAALAVRSENSVSLNAAHLLDAWPALASAEASRALAARLVRRAVEELKGELKRLTAQQVDRVLHLAASGQSGDRVELAAGLVAERRLGILRLFRQESGKRTSRSAASYWYPVQLGSRGEAAISIAETGKRVRLKLIDWPATGRDTYLDTGVLDADRLASPLVLRNWRPGDAYRPRGRGHSEKLKRLLLDRRVGGTERAVRPVLTCKGQPVWAEGLAVAADFAAGPATSRALVVEVSESGSPQGESGLSRADSEPRSKASKEVCRDSTGRRGVATGPERGRT